MAALSAKSKTARVPRVVVVTRPTAWDELLATHGTRAQADFFLETRGQTSAHALEAHAEQRRATQLVSGAIPRRWRRAWVGRSDLDRFLFEPDDLLVAVGPDGLVANVAKYLSGQPVIGLDPYPARNAGVLVRHPPEACADLLSTVAGGTGTYEERRMVEAVLDDGQRLLALNEVFIGHHAHQSARYRIRLGEHEERHSSSGLIVATGTGATGWARSIHRQRRCDVTLPGPEQDKLAFFVREAWPSSFTDCTLTEGELGATQELEIVSELERGGVAFGDGIEADHLELSWGRRLITRLAPERLRLLV